MKNKSEEGKKYDLIYCEWLDACAEHSWFTDDNVDSWIERRTKDLVKEVGWLIRETDKYIVLAQRFAPENEYGMAAWGNLQLIPTTWITKRRKL